MTDLHQLPAWPQSQQPLSEQMAALVQVANRLGLYDAADAVQQLLANYQAPPHHGAPAMSTPNRPPLWREMAGAWSARVIVGRPDAERLAIAAEIRAVAHWIERRQVDEYGVTLPDVCEVIGWLAAEADRAERGDD